MVPLLRLDAGRKCGYSTGINSSCIRRLFGNGTQSGLFPWSGPPSNSLFHPPHRVLLGVVRQTAPFSDRPSNGHGKAVYATFCHELGTMWLEFDIQWFGN